MDSSAGMQDKINNLLEGFLNLGDLKQASFMLGLAPDLEQPEVNTKNTLLHRCVLNGNKIAAGWLINNKARIDALNKEGNTPLLLAILNNQDSITMQLLKNAANRLIKNNDKFDAVALAVLNDNKEILLHLDEEHANLPYLHLALAREDLPLLKKLLEKKEYDIEEKNSSGCTPLHVATAQNSLEAVEILLAEGANPAAICDKKQIPLHIAAENGSLEIVNKLLETEHKSKINMDAEDIDDNTPLHLAAKLGKTQVIPALLLANANHKSRNNQWKTPAKLAIQCKQLDTAKLIQKTMRDIKLKSLDKIAILHQEISQLKQEKTQVATTGAEVKAAAETKTVERPRIAAEYNVAKATEEIAKFKTRPQQHVAPHAAQPNVTTQPTISEVNPEQLQTFLRLVAEGEQDQAEAMLKGNRKLVFCNGNVTDLSGRTFNNITGFQYAVWALDWHMWTMIQKYLIIEEDDIYVAYAQIKGLETGAWIEEYGQSASWKNLIDAFNKCIILLNQEEYSEADLHWIKAVGRAQLLLPAHVINEYCHPNRPLYPCPHFKVLTELPRSRKTNEGEWFSAVYNNGKLGHGFANWRYSFPMVVAGEAAVVGRSNEWRKLPTLDSECIAVTQLFSIRSEQRKQLCDEVIYKCITFRILLPKFLRLVVEGEQDRVEAMLKENPDLAFHAGNIVDLSGRAFNNITAFQYSVWALDSHMWQMLQKYLPIDEAAKQVKALETGSWVKEHGKSASWQNLIDALGEFIKLCDESNLAEASAEWNTRVGIAQQQLPVHVVNQYCHPTRSFDPCPAFKDMTLIRNRNTSHGDWFDASYSDNYKLGYNFAFCRGNRVGVALSSGGGKELNATHDLLACAAYLNYQQKLHDKLLTDLASTLKIAKDNTAAISNNVPVVLKKTEEKRKQNINGQEVNPSYQYEDNNSKVILLSQIKQPAIVQAGTRSGDQNNGRNIYYMQLSAELVKSIVEETSLYDLVIIDDTGIPFKPEDNHEKIERGTGLFNLYLERPSNNYYIYFSPRERNKTTTCKLAKLQYKQNINGQEVNESYQYEDNDVNAILRTRLTEIINKREYTGNPYRIQVLAAIDGMSPLALEDAIGENRANFPGEQTLLIPYNVGHYHWIGILLHFNADGQITKAQHMDSLGCHDFNLIQDRLNAANYNCTLKQLNLLQQHDGTSCGAYMVENLLLALQNKNILTTGLTCAEIRSKHLCSLQSLMPDFYAAFYQRQLSNSSSIVSLNSRLGYRKQDTAKPEEVKFTSFELKKILDICDNIQGFSNKTITAQLCNAFKNPCSNADTEHSIHLNAIRSALSRIADELNITNATVQDSEQLAKLVNLLFCKEWKIGESLTEEFMDRLWVDYEQILAVGKLAFDDVATISKQLRQDIAKQITDDEQLALKLQSQLYHEHRVLDSEASHIETTTIPIIFSRFTLKVKTSEQDFSHFLRLVAEGEQDQVEAMLKQKPKLGLLKGNVTDLSGRTFENITGFQYAVWALDSHMWEMCRNYLSPEEVKMQIQGMDIGSWVAQHGKSASWQNLIDALDEFIILLSQSDWDRADMHWNTNIGNAQQQLPTHVVNQYCHPTRSFDPCPDFEDETPFQRNRNSNFGDFFTSSHDGRILGKSSFAFFRGYHKIASMLYSNARWLSEERNKPWINKIPAMDRKACDTYLQHQIQLRENLFSEVLGNQAECMQAKVKLTFALQ